MRARAAAALALAGGLFAGLALLPRGQTRPSDGPPVAFADYPEMTPRHYLCYRAAGPVVIDGKLDDAAWAQAPWSEAFVDIEGDRKPPPRHRTRMKMLWDDQYLYIAAWLDEPHVQGTMTKHDSYIFHDDNDFEVFLDPDGDSHHYAELEMNARNTTWDLLLTRPYKDGGRAIDAWEIHDLRTAVHVEGTINDPRDTDRGWGVEIAWPWKSLREISYVPVPPRDGDQWRVNFSRVQWRFDVVGGRYQKVKGRPEDNWVWSPQGVINMHRPERWGVLQFTTAAPGPARVRPDPHARVRHLLHRAYYAQADYRQARGRWARSLGELGLRGPEYSAFRLETTATSYEVTAPGGGRRWHIRSDARIWAE